MFIFFFMAPQNYIIAKTSLGGWTLNQSAEKSPVRKHDIMVDVGKNPRATYNGLQKLLGGLDEKYHYEPIPQSAVVQTLSRAGYLSLPPKQKNPESNLHKDKPLKKVRVPKDWHNLAAQEIPELWSDIEKISFDKAYAPQCYVGPTATLGQRQNFCLNLLRLTVFFSYAYHSGRDDHDELTGAALEGLASCAMKYESGEYKPGSLLRTYVHGKILREIDKSQNLFNLPKNVLSAWRRYERKLEEWFAEGKTSSILEERYDAFVALGGSDFIGKNTPFVKALQTFAATESLYFASFGQDRADRRQTLKSVRNLEDCSSSDEPVNISDLQTALENVLSTLSRREAEIIKLRTGIFGGRTHTLEEIMPLFGVTGESIRQIEKHALRKLQHPLRQKMLERFRS